MYGALITVAVVVAGYLLIALTLYLSQRQILFRPDRTPPDLARTGLPDVQPITVVTEDGLTLLAWYMPPAADGGPVVLYLHGNAGHIGNRGYRLEPFRSIGWGVLLLEYRGYGGNAGRPSESGLTLDAHAGLAALRQMGFPLSAILLWGESLGSGLAVRLAVEHPVVAVLLEAPYTSIAAIARLRYPLLPVDWLLLDRFDTLSIIGSVRAPVFVVHGALDHIVPVAMGRAIFAAAPDPKELCIPPQAGHLDLVEAGAIEAAAAFVARLATK